MGVEVESSASMTTRKLSPFGKEFCSRKVIFNMPKFFVRRRRKVVENEMFFLAHPVSNIVELQADQLVDVMSVIFISQEFGFRPSGPSSCPFKSDMRGSAIESRFIMLRKGTCNIVLNPGRVFILHKQK
jgi:hypothetical protein